MWNSIDPTPQQVAGERGGGRRGWISFRRSCPAVAWQRQCERRQAQCRSIGTIGTIFPPLPRPRRSTHDATAASRSELLEGANNKHTKHNPTLLSDMAADALINNATVPYRTHAELSKVASISIQKLSSTSAHLIY
jgi:hypothetical protein